MEKLLGEGWTLSVFKDGARLFLSIPVDSGFASQQFEFDISQRDFSVLKEHRSRRERLAGVLHEMLQPRLTRGGTGASDTDCHAMIQTVLHGSTSDIEDAIGQRKRADR